MTNASGDDADERFAPLRFWGTPWSSGTSANAAFQGDLEECLRVVPSRLDVLMTHGPIPKESLLQLSPRLYAFGHHHEMHGVRGIGRSTVTICSSIMNKKYNPLNLPIVVDVMHRQVK